MFGIWKSKNENIKRKREKKYKENGTERKMTQKLDICRILTHLKYDLAFCHNLGIGISLPNLFKRRVFFSSTFKLSIIKANSKFPTVCNSFKPKLSFVSTKTEGKTQWKIQIETRHRTCWHPEWILMPSSVDRHMKRMTLTNRLTKSMWILIETHWKLSSCQEVVHSFRGRHERAPSRQNVNMRARFSMAWDFDA